MVWITKVSCFHPPISYFRTPEYRTFAHWSIVFSPTNTIVLSPTSTTLKPSSLLSLAKRNTRARFSFFNLLTKNLGGALPPLQTTLQEGAAKGMRLSRMFLFFRRCNYKIICQSSLLFIPRPLTKTIRGFRGIKRTLRARA